MSEPRSTASEHNKPLVVIGSGLAGYTFIRELRKLDVTRRILLVTADDGHSYSKPMLSTGFAKKKVADQLSLADAGKMASQLDIDIRTHTWVSGIDPEAGCVSLAFGSQHSATESVEYSQLVLALGAEVVRLDFAGDAAADVLSVNSLTDYRQFRDRLDRITAALDDHDLAPRKIRIVIIGSGLIGCEFANDLLASENISFSVEMIAPDSRPLQRVLPDPVSRALERGLSDAGTRFHWHSTVHSIDHDTEAAVPAYLVTIENTATGKQHCVSADLVLSATGLKPHTVLAAAAGLQVNRGIVVDRQLRTSSPDIFALGDCAEVDGHLLLYVQPLMQCARLLAANLSEAAMVAEVSYQAMPVIVKTPACPLVLSPPPEGLAGAWTTPVADGLDVRALFHDNAGQLRGFALSGRHVIEKQALLRDLPPLHA